MKHSGLFLIGILMVMVVSACAGRPADVVPKTTTTIQKPASTSTVIPDDTDKVVGDATSDIADDTDDVNIGELV